MSEWVHWEDAHQGVAAAPLALGQEAGAAGGQRTD